MERKDDEEMTKLKESLALDFEMKDLGKLHLSLGIKVVR